ncbi:MAG: hypothetical protein HQ567_18545, partial [Candidatus Nealsonbacteria bacterium]|nr:hypothetical protein [Candidatus Nealsonbacteria bacterium]
MKMRTGSLAICRRTVRGDSHGPLGAGLRRLRFEALEDRRLLDAAGGEQAIELFSVSPALFVENQGQWADESVRFMHQGDGVNVAMTDTGPVFQLFKREEDDSSGAYGPFDLPADLTRPEEVITQVTEFSAHFVGANLVEPVGLDRAETYFNYFVGDQENWRSEVPGYGVVAYEGLYGGIDLHTWGKRSHLKYEFHVAPGADYRQIKVSYDGIDGLWLDDAGAMHVETPLGELVDEAPYIYQDTGGVQVEVPGRFELIDANTYTFILAGTYDREQELIIDPALDWSTYLGGNFSEMDPQIVMDSADNILVSGETGSSSGWISGGYDTSYGGGTDVFVVKLSPAGGRVWSTYLGGNFSEMDPQIVMDSADNILVSG